MSIRGVVSADYVSRLEISRKVSESRWTPQLAEASALLRDYPEQVRDSKRACIDLADFPRKQG